jgi:hypothetical protein
MNLILTLNMNDTRQHAECRYAVIMVNVIIPSVIVLSVVMPSVVVQYMTINPGPNVIKHFISVIYKCS